MTEHRDFDAVAATWDEEPRRVRLAREIAAAMMAKLPLSTTWDAMDFGCGTGLLTLQLAPLLHKIIGVDSSLGMLDSLSAKLTGLGITNVQTKFRDQDDGSFPDGMFQLITSAMTLHHVPEIMPLLKALHSKLEPGGWIALADLEEEDGRFHEDQTGVFHHGFNRAQLTEMLAETGYSDICITTVTSVAKGGREYPVFLAIARAF